jgi:hypothetical protein
MRRADDVGIIFSLRVGRHEFSVLKPDPRLEVSAKSFSIR